MRDENEGSTAAAEHEEATDQQETKVGSGPAETVEEELTRLKKRQERENEVVTKIFATRDEISTQEVVIDGEKGKLKLMEAKLDKLNQELCEIVRGQGDTLFDGITPKPESPDPVAPTPDDDAWRSVLLSDIGIDPKLVEKLAAANLNTIGDYADFTNAGQKRITDIDGIGPAAEEEIDAAFDIYWKNNPRQPKANPANEAIVVPFDIGLNREDILANVCEDLLENAEQGNGDQKVPALNATVAGVERPYINVGNLDPETREVNAAGDKPTNRLIPLLTPEEFKAAFPDDEPTGDDSPDDDKLVGIKVKAGRKTYFVGKRSESLLVSVAE